MGFWKNKGLGLALAVIGCVLSLVGCTGKGEAVCVTPLLSVFPEEVTPGDVVTITWEGNVLCGDELMPPLQDGSASVSLAVWNGYQPPEPYTPPDVVVSTWAEITVPGKKNLPSVVSVAAVVPNDLPPGQYYVFIPEADLILSPPFTVVV